MSDVTSTEEKLLPSHDEEALFNEKLRFLIQSDCLQVPSSTPTAAVVEKMKIGKTGGVLVLSEESDNQLVGVFTERDYLDKLAGDAENLSSPISEFMTQNPKCLTAEDTVGKAIKLMTEGGYRHLPITDSAGSPLGLVSVRNIVNYISEHFPEEVFNHPPEIHQTPSTQEGG